MIAALILHVVLAWLGRQPGVLTGQDDAEYITLSQSIRQGGYNELFRVGAPVHRTYPPGYPAALAAWGLIDDSFDSLVVLNIAISVAILVVFFGVTRRVFDPVTALVGTIVLAINPELVEFAGRIVSEPLYILLTLLSLGCLVRPAPGRRHIAFALGLAVLAALTRTVGVTLIIALVLHWLVEKRWKLVGAIVATGIAGACAWLLWSARGPDPFVGASYAAELAVLWKGLSWTGPLPTRALRWAIAYAGHGIPWQLGVPAIAGTSIDNILIVTAGAACGIAGMVVMYRRWQAAAAYLAVYMALLIVWLYFVERFVLPVVPLIVIVLLAGAIAIGRRVGPRMARAAPIVVAIIIAIGSTARLDALIRDRVGCHDSSDGYPPASCLAPDQASYFDALRWIAANTPDGAVVLTSKPGAMWLYTDRLGAGYDHAIRQDSTAFIAWLLERNANWVLLGNVHDRERTYLAPLIRANCSRLTVAAAFPRRTWLFTVRPQPDGAADGADACDAIRAYFDATPATDSRE